MFFFFFNFYHLTWFFFSAGSSNFFFYRWNFRKFEALWYVSWPRSLLGLALWYTKSWDWVSYQGSSFIFYAIPFCILSIWMFTYMKSCNWDAVIPDRSMDSIASLYVKPSDSSLWTLACETNKCNPQAFNLAVAYLYWAIIFIYL